MVKTRSITDKAICHMGGWCTEMRMYMMSGVQNGMKENTLAIVPSGLVRTGTRITVQAISGRESRGEARPQA